MAITTALCTSFKVDLLKGVHNFTNSTGHTFKLGLFKQTVTGTYDSTTDAYADVTTNSDEVANGNGYTTGGATLTNVTPVSSSTTAYTDFADVTYTSSTFNTDGCFVYNDTATGDPTVFVYDFGGTKSVAAGTLTIAFPTPNSSSAIIRIA